MKKFTVVYITAAGTSTETVTASYMYISDNNAVFYDDNKKAIGVIPLGNVKSILPVAQ